MSWMPFVTLRQVTLDMVLAAEVPGGLGHTYTSEAAFFWTDLLEVEDEVRVKAILDALSRPNDDTIHPYS